jgi:hopene-associated glycosyltransferase HpnB
MNAADVLGGVAAAAWAYLLVGRGGFWLTRERDAPAAPPPPAWPSVTAVIPARDEADVIARAVASLKAQDYPGTLEVIVVDDASSDSTAAEAAQAGARVIAGVPLPGGWTGKVWAQSQGVTAAGSPDYLLLTDADIVHAGDSLRLLMARSEADGLALNSLMALLSVERPAERLLIPAFVLFFQMLYPFAWVNWPRARTAAAAGGVMLVRRAALEAAGGLAAIRGALIDDCALAAALKKQAPIRLSLTRRARSLRPYAGFGEIAAMVARSAYAQLGHSPWLLAGTLVGMAVVWGAPPLVAVAGHGLARAEGVGAWAAMTLAYQPMLRFYRLSPLWGLALPLIGLLYGAFTLWSAILSWRGRGGRWKGRLQAGLTGAAP